MLQNEVILRCLRALQGSVGAIAFGGDVADV
jgi:hypothetical protein